jgi:hypothetical protein
VKVYITTGEDNVYVATRPVQVRIPVSINADGQEPEFELRTVKKPFLQIVDSEDGTTILPLTEDQRQKFKEQDVDGKDLARVDKWLYETIGAVSHRPASLAN